MVPSAQQARTTLALTAAGAAVLAAVWLRPGAQPPPEDPVRVTNDDGVGLTAQFASSQILVGEQDVAVTVRIPTDQRQPRPPLALAIVIDRSGSMNGAPLANAKAAAKQLVEELDQGDAFSIVTFSSGDETVAPMALATPSNKLAADRAIDGIVDGGGTCTSCGLTRGLDELEAQVGQDRLRRIVLMSDGQANEGIWDRHELVAFAGRIGAHGTSISTVGVGLDFDEVTMTNIANVGHGNYYFVEDTRNLPAMFARELGGLTATVATNATLSIAQTSEFEVLYAYGYPLARGADASAIIPIADLRAGETRKVVLHVRVGAGFRTAATSLVWQGVADHHLGHAAAMLAATITTDSAAVTASVDRDAVHAIEEALSAKALDDAATTYQRDGYAAAKTVLEQRAKDMRDHAAVIRDPVFMRKLDTANGEAIESFKSAPPAKATKAVRVKAYELSR